MRHPPRSLVIIVALLLCNAGPPWQATPNARVPSQPRPGEPHAGDPCARLPGPPGEADGIHKMCPPKGSSSGIAKGDFNDDGFAGLAVGIPGKDTEAVQDAGAVAIIHGSPDGLTTNGAAVPAPQLLFLSSLAIPGQPPRFCDRFGAALAAGRWAALQQTVESGDHFGAALAVGDFSGDAREDLAIGAPLEEISGRRSAGTVHLVHASGAGLTAAGNQIWSLAFVESANETGAQFGRALAAGDFNGDLLANLAIGVPFKDAAGVRDAGQVHIIYGAPGGLSLRQVLAHQIWNQNSTGIQNLTPTILVNLTSVEGDRFGSSLTAWNFGHDSETGLVRPRTTDLAIGIPFKRAVVRSSAGAVFVIYGCFTCPGLNAVRAQVWTLGNAGMPDSPALDDHFGAALY